MASPFQCLAASNPRVVVAQQRTTQAPVLLGSAACARAGAPKNTHFQAKVGQARSWGHVFTQQPKPGPPPSASSSDSAPASQPEPEPKLFFGQNSLTITKVLILGAMFFCILFNYTTIRNTKDVLVVTAPGGGAEVLPFLKTLNLPLAVAFTVVYTQLANRLSNQALFYACLLPFIIFFGAFALFVYPNKDLLHPTALCDRLLESWGSRWAAPLSLLRSWTFSAFYMVAEMWGSVVISLLFWGTANQVMSVDEAATFYPLFGMGANLSLIVAGNVTSRLSELRASLPPGVDGWEVALRGLMGLVVLNGVIISALYAALQKWVVPKVMAQREADAAAGRAVAAPKPKKKKLAMSTGESMRFLASSPYIRDLATMVVAYGVAINLVEVTWKSKLKMAYPSPSDYSAFMGRFSEAIGYITLGMMLVGRFVLKRWGWGVAALSTPAVLLGTAVVFFTLVLSEGLLSAPMAALGTTPLVAAVMVGAAQNVFSRSAKYSLFDPCKEMAYIPLDDEMKNKGKAAVDVVGNLIGKSGGAFIQQSLILVFGSLASSTSALAVILIGVIVMWMRAVLSLEKQFHGLMDSKKMQSQEEEEEVAGDGDGSMAAGGATYSNGAGRVGFASAVSTRGPVHAAAGPAAGACGNGHANGNGAIAHANGNGNGNGATVHANGHANGNGAAVHANGHANGNGAAVHANGNGNGNGASGGSVLPGQHEPVLAGINGAPVRAGMHGNIVPSKLVKTQGQGSTGASPAI